MHETWQRLSQEGILLAGVPFLATALLIFLLKPVAVRLSLVDNPACARKTHADPTPLVGGAAITFAGLIAGAILLPATPDLIALAAASLLLLVVGEFDDRYDINWRIRIIAQGVAALVLYVWGGVRVESIGNALGFPGHTLGPLSLPFTVLATVGITNAMNWADGIDGLAGSLSLATFLMLVAASVYAGNAALATDLMLLAGCVMGFLAFNLRTPWRPRATVFLGCGAEILGLWIAWASFRLTQSPLHPVTPVLAPFLIAPPVIDCLVLIVRRLRARRSPFSADRDHMHHRLGDLGLSATAIVALLVAITLVGGLCAAVARRAHVPEPVFPAVYLGVTCAYFFITRRASVRRVLGQRARPESTRALAEPTPIRARVERSEA